MGSISVLLVGVSDDDPIMDAFPPEVEKVAVEDGHGAVFAFSKHNPDLVIIGADVSHLPCVEVAEAIRSIAPDAELVFVAGEIDDQAYDLAVGAGVAHFIETDRLRDNTNMFLGRILSLVETKRNLEAGQTILEHILKGFPHAALLIDWSAREVLSVNKAAEALGYDRGMGLGGFLFPGEWHAAFLDSLMAGIQVFCFNVVSPQVGLWKTTSVMTSSKTVFFMAENITDAALAQERIQQSENLLTAIFDNSYDSIILFDDEHRAFKVNQRVQDMFGHAPEDITELRYRDFVQPPAPLEHEESERFRMALQGVPQLFEARAIRNDGQTTFKVEVFLRGLTVDNEPRVLATIRDVTERHRAEVDFISIQRELAEHLAERKAALIDLSERLRVELSKCDMLQDKMTVAQKSYKQVIVTARNDIPTSHSLRLACGDLSSRELQVVMQLAKGTSVTVIAEDMGLSPKTVSTYKRRAMQKLNLGSESELTLYALRVGLIEP